MSISPFNSSYAPYTVYAEGSALLDPIKKVEVQGDCARFDLRKNAWDERIQEIVEKNYIVKYQCYRDVLLVALFALSIDSELSGEEKSRRIGALLSGQEPHFLEKLYDDLATSLPVSMSISIFRYRDQLLQECSRIILKHMRNSECMKKFQKWISEVIQNDWPQASKELFFQKFFETLPPAEVKEVVASLLIKNISLSEFNCAGISILEKQVDQFIQEVKQHLDKSLQEEQWGRVNIPYRGAQRAYFLCWYLHLGLQHSNSCNVALELRREDWQWLKSNYKTRGYGERIVFLKKVLEMITTLSLKCQETLLSSKKESPKVKLSPFFEEASALFTAAKKMRLHTPKGRSYLIAISVTPEFDSFLKSLSVPLLYHYFNKFDKKFSDYILYYLIHFKKDMLNEWIAYALTDAKEAQEKVEKLISRLRENKHLSTWIDHLFKEPSYFAYYFSFLSSNPSQERSIHLAVYCCLEKKEQKELLSRVLLHSGGLERLLGWVECSLHEKFPASLKLTFAQNFYKRLHEIDLSAAQTLCNQAKIKFQGLEVKEFLQLLLPHEINMSDAQARLGLAMQKLEAAFGTHELNYSQKKEFAHALLKECKTYGKSSDWLPQLFRDLPQAQWPLLFVYFQDEIYQEFYPKGLGSAPTFKLPLWLEEERWIDLALNILLQTIDNPLTVKLESEFIFLYKVIVKTPYFSPLLKKFVNEGPPEKFIPLMNKLAEAFFFTREDEFKKYLNSALPEEPHKKIEFVTQSIVAEWKREEKSEKVLGPFDLKEDFWSGDIFFNSAEKAALTKELVKRMDTYFLIYFYRLNPIITMMQSLAKNAPFFCKRLLIESIIGLERCLNDPLKQKFILFQNICYIYRKVGFDLNELLTHPEIESLHSTLRDWYSNEELFPHIKDFKSAVILQNYFNPSRKFEIFSKKLEAALEKSYNPIRHLERFLIKEEKKGEKRELLERVFKERPELMEALKQLLQRHFVESFIIQSTPAELPSLFCRLLPHWQRDLTQAILKLNSQNDPQFHIYLIYQCLVKNKLMASWRASIPQELEGKFAEIDKKYRDKQRIQKGNI